MAGVDGAAGGMRPSGGGAVAVAIVAAASLLLVVGTAVWPMLTLLVAVTVGIAVLAWRSPALAFCLAILLFGIEGTIKVRLTIEGSPLPVAGDAVGAAFIDLCFCLALLGLARHDRGRTIRRIWTVSGTWQRLAFSALAGWLVVSAVQVFQNDSLVQGLLGFRLVQGYVVAIVAGTALLAVSAVPQRTLAALAAVLGLVSGYAALRAAIGPATSERIFALSQDTTSVLAEGRENIFKGVGSFSSAIGLVSFLVPAAGFAFGLASLRPLRLLAWLVFGLAVGAVFGTYTRAALVAVAIALVATGVLLLVTEGRSRRRRLLLAAAVAALIAVGGVATSITFSGSSELRERGRGILHPLSDDAVKIRWRKAKESFEVLRDRPFGTGVGSVGHATEVVGERVVTVDNSYLKILREQGVVGGALFLLGVLGTGAAVAHRLVRRATPTRPLGIAAFGGFVGSAVLALAWETVEQPGKVLAWTLLGMAAWAAWEPQAGSESISRRDPAVGRRRFARPLLIGCLGLGAALATVSLLLSLARDGSYSASRNLVVHEPGSAEPVAADSTADVRAFLDQERLTLKRELFNPELRNPLLADEDLLARAEIRPGGSSRGGLVTLSVAAATPRRARDLANALAERLLDAPILYGLRTGRPVTRGLAVGPPARMPPLRTRADRAIARLPVAFPARPHPLWALGAGCLVALALGGAGWLALRGSAGEVRAARL